MAFRDAWKKFIPTPWFRITYTVLMGVLTALLFPFVFGAAACLALLVIPLTVFVVPYWFGERKAKRFIVNGLVVFVVALLLLGLLRTQAVLSAEPFEVQSFTGGGQDPTMSLLNGTVSPFRSEGPTPFTFEVVLRTTDNMSPADFAVWMNLTIVDGVSIRSEPFRMVPAAGASDNTRNGTRFTNTTTLGGAIYGFGFAVQNVTSGNWTTTPVLLAPIAAPAATFFAFFLIFSLPLILFTFAFYLIILFMWWWSSRMRRRMVPPREEEEAAEEPNPRPADAGKASKAAAFTCTNCGADVTEDATSCAKCGAVFED